MGMVLLGLAIWGWNHPVWGPLLHEISWPLWVWLVVAAVAEFVDNIIRPPKGG